MVNLLTGLFQSEFLSNITTVVDQYGFEGSVDHLNELTRHYTIHHSGIGKTFQMLKTVGNCVTFANKILCGITYNFPSGIKASFPCVNNMSFAVFSGCANAVFEEFTLNTAVITAIGCGVFFSGLIIVDRQLLDYKQICKTFDKLI